MRGNSICVHGKVGLQGKVKIQGSKNAALPILAATLLTRGENVIYNCPKISDIYHMQQLLKSMGCVVKQRSDCVCVNASNVWFQRMPSEAIRGMRSSVCMLGVLLARFGEIMMENPGGCVIGERPIDMHINALKQMGAVFEQKEEFICAHVQGRLHGADICFQKVSVGATENVILAAVLAEGTTLISGAAREPEVVALCLYLRNCGADIRGIGSDTLKIRGVDRLYATEVCIPADRIVAGTYLLAAIVTGGCAWLEDAPCNQMNAILNLAEEMGALCQRTTKGLYVQAPGRARMPKQLQTNVYPGFPTDLQSIAMVAMLQAEGNCIIEETIFENRFHIVKPLRSMGADLEVIDATRVRVKGVLGLQGREVEAKELRGGAALVVAGLGAHGVTQIRGSKYIMRGYENICKDLRELGARVVSV